MTDVLDGATVVSAAAIALFFLRFHGQTGDRFFALFAAAFTIFAVNRVLLVALDDETEARTFVYLARAAGFGLIAYAIIDKNRPHARRG